MEFLPGEPLGKSSAAGEAQSVAQAARPEGDRLDQAVARGMGRKQRAILVESLERGLGQAPGQGEGGVERAGGVALRQDDDILRSHPPEAEIHEDFQATQRRTDVAGMRLLVEGEQLLRALLADGLKRGRHERFFATAMRALSG